MDRHPPEYYAEDRGTKLIAIACTFTVITTVVVTLQFYAKRYSAPRFDTYDFFLLGGYVLNLVVCAMAIGQYPNKTRTKSKKKKKTQYTIHGKRVSVLLYKDTYML